MKSPKNPKPISNIVAVCSWNGIVKDRVGVLLLLEIEICLLSVILGGSAQFTIKAQS